MKSKSHLDVPKSLLQNISRTIVTIWIATWITAIVIVIIVVVVIITITYNKYVQKAC